VIRLRPWRSDAISYRDGARAAFLNENPFRLRDLRSPELKS
jgi:hypothetical protein